MRDYALTCAASAGMTGTSPVILLRNWWSRRVLARLDDAGLHALGLEPDDRNWALGLPLGVDITAALEDRQFRRSRAMALRASRR